MDRSFDAEFDRMIAGFVVPERPAWQPSFARAATRPAPRRRVPVLLWQGGSALVAAAVAAFLVAVSLPRTALPSSAHAPAPRPVPTRQVVIVPSSIATPHPATTPAAAPATAATPPARATAPAPSSVPAAPGPIAAAPPAAAAPANLLQNPSFESGLSPWALSVTSPATATGGVDCSSSAPDGRCSESVNVSATGCAGFSCNWYVQVQQKDFALQAGRTYTLTFWARASSNQQIDVTLQTPDGTQMFINAWNTNLTGGWQKFTETYTSTAAVPGAMVGFNLGAGAATYWIDGVSLTAS